MKPGMGLDVPLKRITRHMRAAHDEAVSRIRADQGTWTSHTVVVVDQSGSMRKTDIGEDVSRSDAVWLSLAVDFVARSLEAQTATPSDVVSVVAMGPSGTVLIDRIPHDWIFYNAVVALLRSQEPNFDGNYLRALDTAEQLLVQNASGSCALALLFLSDGRPSDQVEKRSDADEPGATTRSRLNAAVNARVGALASRLSLRPPCEAVSYYLRRYFFIATTCA